MKNSGLDLTLLVAGMLVFVPSGGAIMAFSFSPQVTGEDIAYIGALTLPPVFLGLFLGRWVLRKVGEKT